jgi:hypothetical protein
MSLGRRVREADISESVLADISLTDRSSTPNWITDMILFDCMVDNQYNHQKRKSLRPRLGYLMPLVQRYNITSSIFAS